MSTTATPNPAFPASTYDAPVTGKAADAAHEAIDKVAANAGRAEQRVRESVSTAAENLDGARARAREQLSEQTDQIKEQTRALADATEQYVKAHPVASISLAFAAGLIASRVLSR